MGEVAQIDQTLFHLAALLDRAQPSRTGKISLRFRRSSRRTEEGQRPVFVRWERLQHEVIWRSVPLKTESVVRSMQTAGAFSSSASLVKEVLVQARKLVTRRESLLRMSDNLRRALVIHVGTARKERREAVAFISQREPLIEAARTRAVEASAERRLARDTEQLQLPRARS